MEEGNIYRIKITSLDDTNIFDISDNYFTISRPPFIQLISPKQDQELRKGHTYDIEWDSNVNGNVKIDLWQVGKYILTITDETQNDGMYHWLVPTNLSGWQHYILITSIDHPDINGRGAIFFIID